MSAIHEIAQSQLKRSSAVLRNKEEQVISKPRYFDIFGDEEKLEILIQAPEKEFIKYQERPEFEHLFKYPFEERMYEKRIEFIYSSEIKDIKPNRMKWKEFYIKISIAEYHLKNYKNDPEIRTQMKDVVAKCDEVIFQLYYFLEPNLNVKFLNAAFAGDCLNIAQWLVENEFEEIDDLCVQTAFTMGSLNCLKWVYTLDLYIIQENIEYAFFDYNKEVYDWLDTLHMQYNSQCYMNALIKHNKMGIRWLLKRRVPYSYEVDRYARKVNLNIDL